MPLPYPSLLQSGAGRTRCPSQLGINCVVLTLNWLYLGQPSTCPRTLSLHLGAKPSARQWRAVLNLKRNVEFWNRAGTFGPAEMGRAASKFEGLEDRLQACKREWASVPEGLPLSEACLSFEVPSHALPVEPDRLNFPGQPSFDPTPFLDTANRRVYEDPLRPKSYALGLGMEFSLWPKTRLLLDTPQRGCRGMPVRKSFVPVTGALADELLACAVLLCQSDVDLRAEGAPLLIYGREGNSMMKMVSKLIKVTTRILSGFEPLSPGKSEWVGMREPDVAEPFWLREAFAGRFEAFDSFLEQCGMDLNRLAGLPDPAELLPDFPVDVRNSEVFTRLIRESHPKLIFASFTVNQNESDALYMIENPAKSWLWKQDHEALGSLAHLLFYET
ncbi:CLPTM1L [Symbiodinium sp. KB8]|nr:CLPTM1L [Symbiodinium sp. KB8]